MYLQHKSKFHTIITLVFSLTLFLSAMAFCVFNFYACAASVPQEGIHYLQSPPFENVNTLGGEPAQFVGGMSPFDNGKLAYTGFKASAGKTSWSPYLYLKVRSEGKDVESQIIKPKGSPSGYMFDPVFSPNGKYIAFGYGWPYDSHGRFEEHIWDVEKQKFLEPIPEFLSSGSLFLSFRKLYWSPDSKYIAYIRGGDQEGNDYSNQQPIRLYIHNVHNGKEHFVIQNSFATQMAWTPQNTLLYCIASEDQPNVISPKHSKIYEFDPISNKQKLLIEDGFAPSPSPDGKYILYFGWPRNIQTNLSRQKNETASKAGDIAVRPQLGGYVFDRKTGKSDLIIAPVSYFTFAKMLWKKESNSVIFTKFLSRSPDAKMQVDEVNIKNRKSTHIATVSARDFEVSPRPKTEPEIDAMSITNDNKYLILSKKEYSGTAGVRLTGKVTLFAIDLTNGKLIDGATTTSFLGVDYYPVN